MGEENEMGTIAFTIRFFKFTLLINTLFSLIGIILGLVAFPRILSEAA
jgi:hypothetical protein